MTRLPSIRYLTRTGLPEGCTVAAAETKQTILVVDDNRDNIEILRAFLESRGYVVAEAPDGRSALARLDELKPDLVLLDVMMPGMDGWQVCRTIKNHPELGTTKVVMVTAKGAFEDKLDGLRSGADDYVVKPVDFKELLEKVQRNLAAGSARA
jgi:two-component system alkaline phosphatase synthesis response regulator PhoP